VSVKPKKNSNVVVYSAGRDTLEANDATFSGNGVQGMALLAGIEERAGVFHRSDFSLRAQVPFGDTLLGLYQNMRENPLSVVPIAILALLVGLLLPVAIFNFRLVGGLGRSFTEPVAALRAATVSLGGGHLDHRVAVEGDDELWQTAAAFNTMAEGLERARTLEQERVRFENELELARRIQERLLPAAPPEVAGLEIAGATEPAREVGGDYYDHLVLNDGRVLLVVADVSGKGVPASLLMSAFRAAIMSQEGALTEPERLAERLNAFLYRSVESGRFVTAFFALLDPATGAMQYVNAGHNPALLLRAGGSVEWLTEGGLILGIMPASTFTRGETQLAAGDLFVLYTDGVTEGANATAEQFGEERLVDAARRLTGMPCGDAARELVREVRGFEGATGPADDITVLIARSVARA
jgi:sigma-B regulation protein RsbU (phosphoserine phosphatase)